MTIEPSSRMARCSTGVVLPIASGKEDSRSASGFPCPVRACGGALEAFGDFAGELEAVAGVAVKASTLGG